MVILCEGILSIPKLEVLDRILEKYVCVMGLELRVASWAEVI